MGFLDSLKSLFGGGGGETDKPAEDTQATVADDQKAADETTKEAPAESTEEASGEGEEEKTAQ